MCANNNNYIYSLWCSFLDSLNYLMTVWKRKELVIKQYLYNQKSLQEWLAMND